MPVMLSFEPDGVAASRRVPLLREKHITSQLANALERPIEDRFPNDVQLVAFHSFKGGVGRTVHAVALADAMARHGSSVLLIDADLEAPGITWMHRAQGGQIDFGFEDLLALLQGAEDGSESAALDIAVSYLPNQQVGRYTGGGRVTLVPASRRSLLGPPRIDPADLLTPNRSPYYLTEALAALAARAGADIVVIDLRAGATELSAPVLLDPRVQRVFVTTLSHQSLTGTEKLLRQLGHRAPTIQGLDPASSVIITQYRQDVHNDQVERACDELGSALFASLRRASDAPVTDAEDTDEVDADLFSRPLLSPFREELLALPASWDAVLRTLENGKIAESLESIMPTPVAPEPTGPNVALAAVDHSTLRRRLSEVARRLIYAEREGMSSASGFLVTDPLRRLLGDHRTEPPIALVVGAKGAGKTFMYAKACAAQSWKRFAEQSGIDGVQLAMPVIPVLESDNLEYDDLTTQDLRDRFVADNNGELNQPASSHELKDRLKTGLSTLAPQDELGWRHLWLECLAAAAGALPEDNGDPEAALAELGKRARAVFVIDGLEDLLQALDNESKCTALRVLLIDVLGWLRSLRGRPFGLVVFVRQDLVTRAVRQNSGQLLARYEPYALRWDKEEALRLALWVTVHANALATRIEESRITDLSSDELVESLIPVWGRKMGTEKSREARSHLWVPAALGDFNDQVQARDVVVFLSEAAELSIPQTTWEDRILAPSAMRKALLACSKNKIDSIQQENQEVGELLSRLQQVHQPVTVPFELNEVGISIRNADFLVDSGVFARGSDGRYWVAEIYRHGLGYGSERRAKVLWRR
ncbi:KGGVGR-motif variant AAA ATPase [Phytomonospora endophytica]|uniref:MinD-like ATPase involved in chromosome partitioning or flagellar assembly n=1 Tax=Phytomonospora endophytica TaxID=714109 RepID=A0A841FQS8_9ACTN|nr:AAA family ATPase [Phytomonospora endophytica]MBB6038194.1 MinD-like ATPase involved in chromosome partitioning or flagellar assembly [Phytomonospora endophytica]